VISFAATNRLRYYVTEPSIRTFHSLSMTGGTSLLLSCATNGLAGHTFTRSGVWSGSGRVSCARLFALHSIAQNEFLYLPGGSLGKRIGKVVDAWLFVVRKTIATEGIEFRRGRVTVLAQLYAGCNHFTPFRIGKAQNCDIRDCGMCEEHTFDFARINVFPAAYDHIAKATVDAAVAQCVHAAYVAGIRR
jgi:hypothetical protein